MTPIYLNSPLSPFPVELNEDQYHQLFSPKPQVSSSPTSSLTCPNFFHPSQDQGGCYDHIELKQLQHQEEADKFVSHGGSNEHPTLENESDNGIKLAIWNKEDKAENQSENGSVKWMSSKMRMMRKMMNSEGTGAEIPTNTMKNFEDQKQPSSPLGNDNSSNNSSSNCNNTIRVCADCNTTKTPLWRSGPKGPKSLCNACGIRQRKARRAMAAAAAAANGTILATNTSSVKSKVQYKDKRSNNGYVAQYKKRCKLAAPSQGRKKLCFEDFTISLGKNSAFHQVFPQDEKEAAILLMALSCGLVHG